MGKRLTLTEYYNRLGKEVYPDWSDETINYRSLRMKEFRHFRERSSKIYVMAMKQIFDDGKVKIAYRIEQGYFDPQFPIEDFDFYESRCIADDGSTYHCVIELFDEKRGRPRDFDYIIPVIKEYVETHYLSKGLPESAISACAVISRIKELPCNHKGESPKDGTIRSRLHELFPGCKRASRNSKK